MRTLRHIVELVEAEKAMISEANPSSLKGQTFYHGTATTKAAEGILAHGLMPNQSTIYRHQLRPADGHVYLTTDIVYAVKYALGKDARTKPYYEYRDQFCYLFIIRGADLKDVVPDEDSIGESMWLNTKRAEGVGKKAWAFDEFRVADTDRAEMQAIWEFLYKAATLKDMRGCCTLGPNRPYAWAAFGKRVQPILPEWIALKLILMGAHVAHNGAVMPSECWKLDRRHQHEVLRSPTTFFEYAERVQG